MMSKKNKSIKPGKVITHGVKPPTKSPRPPKPPVTKKAD